MGIIYILENKINGKCYVGQTIQPFNKRFRKHNQSNSVIGKALRKYRVNNFNKIILENIPEEKLNELEIEYIKKYNSLSPNGYNLTSGGDGSPNKICSKETRNKLREANIKNGNKPPSPAGNKYNLGKILTEEHKKKISNSLKGKTSGMLGKHHTEETKRKISESEKGKKNPHTEETKRKMSISKKGENHPNFGKHLTEETKRKISESEKRTKEVKING